MFVALVEELAEVFVAAGIDVVAGDAVEGFNQSHDVCRFVIDGAVALASRRTGRPIDNRDFVLEAREGRYAEIIRHRQHVLPVRAATEAAVHRSTERSSWPRIPRDT